MNYEEFKKNVIAELRGYLTEELRDCEFCEEEVKKVNRILDGLTLVKPETECGPTVYYQEVYEWFLRNGDFEKCMENIATFFEKGFEALKETEPALYKVDDVKQIKQYVVLNLVNTERNDDLLKTVPHKTFHDLSVIYRCIVDNQRDNGISTFVITNSLMEHLNLDGQTLDSCAKRNMERLLPSSVDKVKDCIYLITNNLRIFGAAVMLDTEILKGLSNKMEDDLYILPSSIHEFFVIPVTGEDETYLKQIVKEANDSVVSDQDFLSNSLYRFDRDTESVELVR